jgi:hypothetical protein
MDHDWQKFVNNAPIIPHVFLRLEMSGGLSLWDDHILGHGSQRGNQAPENHGCRTSTQQLGSDEARGICRPNARESICHTPGYRYCWLANEVDAANQ